MPSNHFDVLIIVIIPVHLIWKSEMLRFAFKVPKLQPNLTFLFYIGHQYTKKKTKLVGKLKSLVRVFVLPG